MIALLLIKYTKQADNTVLIISDLATIFFSAYAGYLFSFMVAKRMHDTEFEASEEKNKTELQKVSKLMGRRILNLTEHLRKLAEEISDFEIRNKKSAEIYFNRISAELTRLAIDASSSVEDVQDTGEVTIPSQDILKDIRTKIYTSVEERFHCPRCNAEHKIMLGSMPGSTTHKNCDCGASLIINRGQDRAVFIGLAKDFKITCPNPECKNQIHIKRDKRSPETGIGIRNCFECRARIEIDLDKEAIKNYSIENPLVVSVKAAASQFYCPNCQARDYVPSTVNSKGEKYSSCRRCFKLILIIEEKK